MKNTMKFNDSLFHIFSGIFGLMAGNCEEIHSDFLEKEVYFMY